MKMSESRHPLQDIRVTKATLPALLLVLWNYQMTVYNYRESCSTQCSVVVVWASLVFFESVYPQFFPFFYVFFFYCCVVLVVMFSFNILHLYSPFASSCLWQIFCVFLARLLVLFQANSPLRIEYRIPYQS